MFPKAKDDVPWWNANEYVVWENRNDPSMPSTPMPIWLGQFREVFRPSRINCLFMNMLRGYLWSLPEEDLKDLRANYAAAISNSSS